MSGPRDLFVPSNLKKFNCTWEQKVSTAFFRGTATGGGTTVETNQRLKVAQLSYELSLDPLLNGTDGNIYCIILLLYNTVILISICNISIFC